MKDWIFLLIDSIRQTETLHGKPPYTARFFGILGTAFYVSLQTICAQDMKKDIVIDGWPAHKSSFSLEKPDWIQAWMEASWAVVLIEVFVLYLPHVDILDIQKVYETRMNDPDTPVETRRLMAYMSPFASSVNSTTSSCYKKIKCMHRHWRDGLVEYLKNRDDDGWKNAQTVPDDLPNKNVRIPVGNDTREENTTLETFLPHPSRFTLLAFYDEHDVLISKQHYLGPRFGEINVSGIVPQDDYNRWKTFILQSLPSESCRKHDIWSMRDEPDDTMKCRAELWSGSAKGYLNPPSQVVWFVWLFLQDRVSSDLDKMAILSNVMIGLFLVAVICWDLKYTVLQPRPLQDFRRWFPSEKIKSWNKGETTGQHWMPYQHPMFVTPPFPDIPSGHSCFSSVTAETMRLWTLTDECFQTAGSEKDVSFLSPLLRPGSAWNGCTLTVVDRSSSIQSSAPKTPVSFNLMTWSSLAEEIGQSRVDGGIHTNHTKQYSSHLGVMVARFVYGMYFDKSKK